MLLTPVALASKSPRRLELLRSLDLTVRLVEVTHSETIDPTWLPHDIPLNLARIKNQYARLLRKQEEVLLTADTIVLLDDKILHKPLDEADAMATLQRLSGRWHKVVTGVCMSAQHEVAMSVTTRVKMSELSMEAIKYYIERYRPYDKAGSYGIQEWIGWSHISRIEGSFSNVMGLPTSEVYEALKTRVVF